MSSEVLKEIGKKISRRQRERLVEVEEPERKFGSMVRKYMAGKLLTGT